MYILILTFVFLVISNPVQTLNRKQARERQNYGVSFRYDGKLLNDFESWSHTFEIALPIVHFATAAPTPCPLSENISLTDPQSPFNCHLKNILLAKYNDIAVNLQNDVDETFLLAKKMLGPTPPPPSANSRSKRSPFSWIGNIAGALFDVVTKEDLERVTKIIEKVHRDQVRSEAGRVAMMDNLTSFMSKANARMDSTLKSLTFMQEEIENLTFVMSNINSETAQIRNAILGLIPGIISKLQLAIEVERKLDLFIIGINALLDRRLSPLLVEHDVLISALEQVQFILNDKHNDFKVVHKHPHYYYHSHSVLYAYLPDRILITIDIPIASTNTKMEVFQVLKFPVPFNDTSSHGTLVQNLPDYIAVSVEGSSFSEISAAQMALCDGTHLITCPDKFPIISYNAPTCAFALFHKKDIDKYCKFEFKENIIVPKVTELSAGRLLLVNIKEIIYTCNGHTRKESGCQFCVIDLPCSCSLMAAEFSLSPRIKNCQNTPSITKYSGLNLAVLQFFFNSTIIDEENADHIYAEKVKYSIPKLHLQTDHVHQTLNENRKLSVDLKKVTDYMKNGRTIFRDNLIESLSTSSKHESSFSLPHVLSYAAFG